jgi:hypothetical protein
MRDPACLDTIGGMRISHPTVVAYLALFVAVGTGGAYAANTITGADVVDESLTGADIRGKSANGSSPAVNGTITGHDISGQPENSANGQPYVNGSLTTWDLADGTVRSRDVRDGGLTGEDVKDASLTGEDVEDASLTGDDVKDASLTGADVTDAALTGADVADDSLKGADVDEASLRVVPEARAMRSLFGSTQPHHNTVVVRQGHRAGTWPGPSFVVGRFGFIELICADDSHVTVRYVNRAESNSGTHRVYYDNGAADARVVNVAPDGAMNTGANPALSPTAERIKLHIVVPGRFESAVEVFLVRQSRSGQDLCTYSLAQTTDGLLAEGL